jgi:DNA polymerase-3 subunit gamma/tau
MASPAASAKLPVYLREGSSDITEIDAASNNQRSDVRDLIESAHYAPLRLRRRVFIIDESPYALRRGV